MNDVNNPDAKTMMNEVLPTPTSPIELRSTPRQRALKRLKHLVATAGATAAAANLASCIGFGVVDPLPEPVQCEDIDPSGWAVAEVTRSAVDELLINISIDNNFIDLRGVEIGRDVSTEGGTLVSSASDGRGGVDAVVSFTDETRIGLRIRVGCNGQLVDLVFDIPIDFAVGEVFVFDSPRVEI